LDQKELYQQFHLDEPWDSPHNLTLVDKMPVAYALPRWLDDRREPHTTYFQVYVGPGAAFEGNVGISLRDFKDGPSSTLLVVVADSPVVWTRPADLIFDPSKPPTRPGVKDSGVICLFGDGSVRSYANDFTDDELRAIITRSGGEPFPARFQ
jgi:hypothetical protein